MILYMWTHKSQLVSLLTDSNSNTAASTRGKPLPHPVVGSTESEAFEAFHLFRTCLVSQLTDLKRDLVMPSRQKQNSRHKFKSESQRKLVKVQKVNHRNKLIKVADSSPGSELLYESRRAHPRSSDGGDEE